MLAGCDLNLLETFLSLVECGSFSACAKALRISQPSVSRKIRDLEEQLRTQLFIRDRHRMELTEAGRRLKQEISPLLSGLHKVVAETQVQPKEFQGTIRFGSLREIGQSTFMRFLLDFCQEHPKVGMDVQFIEEIVLREQLRGGMLDFAVVANQGAQESLRSYKLFDERIVVLTRSSNRATPSRNSSGRVSPLPIVSYRTGDPLIELFGRRYPDIFGADRIDLRIRVNSHRSIFEALMITDGYAVTPYLSAKSLIEEGSLRIVPGFEVTESLYLAHFDNPYLSERDKEFRRYLIQRCRALS